MNECYGFTNPIVLESDAYYFLRKEVEAYRNAISKLSWELERQRQYLRSCNKTDQEPNEVIVAGHDRSVTNAQLNLIGLYEEFLNENYP